jgi:RNA-directed DNA polymerase
MKESYEKGVAIRLGPELCAANRKAGCEALVGVRAGRVLSPEITQSGVPTPSPQAEGHTLSSASASWTGTPTGSTTPSMHGNTSHENREVPGLLQRSNRQADGAQREVGRRTPLMHEPGKSDSRVLPRKVPNNARRRAAEGLEDKIVQRATVAVLNAIYEPEFAGFSYGARPGRNAHQALSALDRAIEKKRVKWVLDADLREFFGSLEHSQLIRFVEHRIGDKRVVRLIRQWLAAGVLEDGTWTLSETGTPQGGSISPLAANLYMHYVFDVWAQRWRRTEAHGDMVIVRYLDDFIVGFEIRADAERFLSVLRERLGQFGLLLHPDKTRLLEFGRYAAQNRRERGQGKPESFQFLGFVHSCGRTAKGEFMVHRHTAAERLRAKLKEVKAELRQRSHDPVPEVGRYLAAVVRGHGQYFGIPGNRRAIRRFRDEVSRLWHHALSRRSQKGSVTWDRMHRLIQRFIPPARIVHRSSSVIFAVMTQGKSPVR